MADDTEKAAITADELKVLYDYHVDEVSVDALEVTDKEYELIMKGWGLPGEDPISEEDRLKAQASAASVAKSRIDAEARAQSSRLTKTVEKITKIRERATTEAAGGTLGKIGRLPAAAVRFVLYSGLNRNNALIVTLRAILLMAPIVFAAVMVYWVAANLLPGGDAGAKGGLSRLEGMDAPFSVSTPTFAVSFPDGFVGMEVNEFFQAMPLARDAAGKDRQRFVLAAVSRENPDRFVAVGTGYGLAANAKTLDDFSRNIDAYANEKEVAAAMTQGSEPGVAPYDRTERSISYGLTVARGDRTLRQYSCLLFADGQAMILNVGYILPDDGDADAASEWCRTVLAGWRDRLAPNSN